VSVDGHARTGAFDPRPGRPSGVLEVILVEQAVVDQPLVLVAGPAMQDGPLGMRDGM